MIQPADHLEVRARGEEAVDRGGLRGDADVLADACAIADDIVAGDARGALGRPGQGREDPDRGGLAGAVVAEQAEHAAGRHREADVAQRPQLAELLAEPVGHDAVRRTPYL